MDIQKDIVNKVAESGLVTFDLADLYLQGERILYDIKQHLFQGLILREKDFREAVKQTNSKVEKSTLGDLGVLENLKAQMEKTENKKK